MNPLEALKQKLRVKPVLEEKERIAVVIKGEQKKMAEPKKRVAKEKEEVATTSTCFLLWQELASIGLYAKW